MMVNEEEKEEEEEEDISYSAVAKLTTKERHKYTQSSGDGCAGGCMVGRSVGGSVGWEGAFVSIRKDDSVAAMPCLAAASNLSLYSFLSSRQPIRVF